MTAAAATDYDYWRVGITARLRTLSPLHCGDGGELPATKWGGREVPTDEGHINTVCQGARGPYIPASTLRGSLRDSLGEDSLAAKALFGLSRGKGEAGKVRVYDAFIEPPGAGLSDDRFWHAKRMTTLRTGVSLNQITGTAASGLLFNFEIVPAGSLFTVTIEADRISEGELEILRTLIAGWRANIDSAIGRGRSRGWGRLEVIDEPKLSLIDNEALRGWLAGDAQEPPPMQALTLSPVEGIARRETAVRFTLLLKPRGPLLVNEPGRLEPPHPRRRDRDDDKQEAEPTVALTYMRNREGHAIVPGSSLRGALRAHAGRILATIAHKRGRQSPTKASKSAADRLPALFGGERLRALLALGDATARDTCEHPQVFSAIDRFTGAVATEKMTIHSVCGALCSELIVDGQLDLDPRRLRYRRLDGSDWWKALLLLLARDLYAGDLVLGWGKSRGYGGCDVQLMDENGRCFEQFDDLLTEVRRRFGENAPARWMVDLHELLGSAGTPTSETGE